MTNGRHVITIQPDVTDEYVMFEPGNQMPCALTENVMSASHNQVSKSHAVQKSNSHATLTCLSNSHAILKYLSKPHDTKLFVEQL